MATSATDPRTAVTQRTREYALYLCLLIAPWVFFYPAMSFEFDADDAIMIVENEHMRDPGNWWRMVTTDAFDRSIKGFDYEGVTSLVGHWRPLNRLSYLIDYTLWGPDSSRFHLTNILIHLASGCLLAWTLRRLGLPRSAAGAASLLFLLHPVAARQVGRISLRADLICGFWSLASVSLALAAHRRGRPRLAWVSWGAVFLAMAGKETGLFLPLFFSLWAYVKHRDLRRAAAESAPYWGVALAYWIVRFGLLDISMAAPPQYPAMGIGTVAMSLLRLAFSYLSELPLPTLVDHLWLPAILHRPDWTVVLSLLGLGAAGWWSVRALRSGAETTVLATLLIITPVAPLLNIWAIRGEAVGELLPFEPHRLYIPAMGFAMLWGVGLMALKAARPTSRRVGYAALTAVFLAYLPVFVIELEAYRSRETLARHHAQLFEDIGDEQLPEALLAQRLNLQAVDLLRAKRYTEASHTLHRVLEMRPYDATALRNLASAALAQDQPDLAISYIETALNPIPHRGSDGVVREVIQDVQLRQTGMMQRQLGQAYQMKGEFETARQHLDLALDIDPSDPDALVAAAWNSASLGDATRAAGYLERFLRHARSDDPRRRFARRKLAELSPVQSE